MPHFAKAALERSLPPHGVGYVHMPELGGLRKPRPDSINLGWRNVSFRGYADYMQTDEFWRAIDRLISLPSGAAIMCAEAVPEVRHITGRSEPARHLLTPFARVEVDRISYPAPDTLAI